MSAERNDEARAELNGEMQKFGLKPAEAPKSNPTKEEEKPKEEAPTDAKAEEKPKEEAKPDEKPKERVERKPEETKEGDEVKDKADKKERPQKYIPLPQYISEKKEMQGRIAELEQKLQEKNDSKTAANADDVEKEIEDEIKAFAEEAGIEDPQVLKKLVSLANKPTMKAMEDLKRQVADLAKNKEPVKSQAQIEAEEAARFNEEWMPFEKKLDEEYPNLSKEQKAEAKTIMDELSHTKEWHKYDLDYIFYRNKDTFEDAIGTKQFKGSGASKTQGITMKTETNERPKLSENPSPQEIRDYEAFMAKTMRSGSLSERPAETL